MLLWATGKAFTRSLVSLIKKSSDNLKQLIVAQAILKGFFSREFFSIAWVPYFNGHNFNDHI